MKKTLFCTGACFFIAMLLTGCKNAIPEMNEAQQGMVVEYAAGTLLKYDKNHVDTLLDKDLAKAEEAALKEKTEDLENTPLPEQTQGADTGVESALIPDENVEIVDNTGNGVSENTSIEKFLGLDSMEFRFTGYEVDDFYPKDGEELYFVMNATEGNKLLVLNFEAWNHSEAEASLDILDKDVSFKINVNGMEKYALTTMLLNDLSSYQGTIAAGANEKLVLVCEISEQQAEKLDSIILKIKNVDTSATISLN